MENTPETNFLTKFSEYLGTIVAIFAALASIFGYLKYGRGKWVKFKKTVSEFLAMPKHLGEVKQDIGAVRAEMLFENNVTLRQKIEHFGDSLKELKIFWTVEINMRRAMFRNSEIPIFECDKNGDLIWCNDAYETLASRSLEDVREKGWRTQVHDEDRYKVIKEWERCVQEKRDFSMRYRISTRKANSLVQVTAACIKDEENYLLGFVGTVKQIDE